MIDQSITLNGRFCACALKVAKMVQNPAKTQVMYETGHGELNFVQY